MRKTIFSLMAITVVVMTTSCTKENLADGTLFTATMEKCQDQYSKTALSNNTLFWTSGDAIRIFGDEDSHGDYSATPTGDGSTANFTATTETVAPSSTYYAVYPASIAASSNTIVLPNTQTSADGSLRDFPMYAVSSTNGLSFKCLCGIIKLNLLNTGTGVDYIVVESHSGSINGTYTVNYNGGSPTLSLVEGTGSDKTKLVCSNQSISTAHDFYLYLPAGSYNLTFRIYDHDGTVSVLNMREGVTINIERSKYTTIILGNGDMSFGAPEGAKGGLFSVSATQKVWFSQGNLYCEVSAWGNYNGRWHFFDEQYQFNPQENPIAFGNSGYGWDDRYDFPRTYWLSPTEAYEYEHISIPSDIAGTNYDWGVYNPIINGGNQAGMWRTPTAAEWQYLWNSRPGATAKRGCATIGNVVGWVLLPDNWTTPSGLTFSSYQTNEMDLNPRYQWEYYYDEEEDVWREEFVGVQWSFPMYNQIPNHYTVQQWRTMEDAGAVFLPVLDYSYLSDYSSSSPVVNYYFSTTGIFIVAEDYPEEGYYWPRMCEARLIQNAGVPSF